MLKSKIIVGLVSVSLAGFAGVTFANDAKTSMTKGHETTTQYVKSSGITAKVKAELLADSDISSFHISVKTVKHVVILSGSVNSDEQKQKAETIAKGVEGVESVKNHLIVKKSKQ